jgi:hypothetical protein
MQETRHEFTKGKPSEKVELAMMLLAEMDKPTRLRVIAACIMTEYERNGGVFQLEVGAGEHGIYTIDVTHE